MALEAFTFINSLVDSNPTASDPRREGDDHLRGIKHAVKQTFPNLTGAMTKTQGALNLLPDRWDLVLAELVRNIVPVGSIILWSGSIISIPSGWRICDGNGGTPDLRDRFVVGAGLSSAVGATGGSVSYGTSNAGGHTPTIQGTSLTTNQIPSHTHTLFAKTSNDTDDLVTGIDAGASGVAGATNGPSANVGGNIIGLTGGGASHTHTADAVADHYHVVSAVPPFYALAYIMKTNTYTAP